MELKKTWKRAISFVLAFAMAFSFTPSVTSRAAAPEDEIVVDATATDVPEAAEAEEFEVETKEVDAAFPEGTTLSLVADPANILTDDNTTPLDERVYTPAEAAFKLIGKYEYTGNVIAPAFVLRYNGVNYSGAPLDAMVDISNASASTVGKYEVTITGNGEEGGIPASYVMKVSYEIVGTTNREITFDGASYAKGDGFDQALIYNEANLEKPVPVNVTAKAANATANTNISYEYYNWSDVKDIIKDEEDYVGGIDGIGTRVGDDGQGVKDTNDTAAAILKEIKDANIKKLDDKPIDAGEYVCFAIVAAEEDLNYGECVAGIEFRIDPLPLYIVPDKNQGKTYGDGKETITFKAYTFYNYDGETTWYEYVTEYGVDPDTVFDKNTYNVITKTAKINGETLDLDTIRPSVEYNGPIKKDVPFITRVGAVPTTAPNQDRTEKAGTYAFVVNTAEGVDTNFDVDNSYLDSIVDILGDNNGIIISEELGNTVYTIKKKELKEVDVKFFNLAGNEVSDLVYPNEGVNRKPAFIARDTIQYWDPAKQDYDSTNKVVVGAWTGTGLDATYNSEFAVSGETSGKIAGKTYKITLQANQAGDYQNYTGSKDITWKIADSTNQALVGIYADGDADGVYGLDDNGTEDDETDDYYRSWYLDEDGKIDEDDPINKKDLFNKGTYTVTFDGEEHCVEPAVKAVKADGPWQNYMEKDSVTEGDVAIVRYKNMTAYKKAVPGEGELVEVKADEDWTNEVPKYSQVGTYTVAYRIESDGGKFAPVEGEFTIKIEQLKITVTAPNVPADTFENESAVALRAYAKGSAIKNTEKADAENAWFVGNKNTSDAGIYVTYSTEDGAFDKAGSYKATVTPYVYKESELEEWFVQTYDALAKADVLDEVNEKLTVLEKYDSWDDLPEETRKATETYDTLTDDKKTAAVVGVKTLGDYKKLYENYSKYNENFVFTTAQGTLTVSPCEPEIEVYVDKSAQVKKVVDDLVALDPNKAGYEGAKDAAIASLTDDEETAAHIEAILENVDVEDGASYRKAAKIKQLVYDWKYGTYDSSKSLIKLRYKGITVDPSNNVNELHYEGGLYAGIDYRTYLGAKLPTVFDQKTKFTVKKVTDDGLEELGEFKNIPAATIDEKLMTLMPGTYQLYATIGELENVYEGAKCDTRANIVDPEEGVDYTTFTVAPGILTVDVDSIQGGETNQGTAPEKLKTVLVKEVDAEDGLAPGDNTYKLQYAYINDGVFATPYVDTLADLQCWDTIGKKTIAIKVVPLVDGEADVEDAYFSWDVAQAIARFDAEKCVQTTVTVKPPKASENDKVADITLYYLAKDSGVHATAVGVDQPIEKTYGTYTENKTDAKNKIVYDDDGNYIPVVKDNEMKIVDLVTYVETELLYNNGFAVGGQNLQGKYVDKKFAPYMDAEKFTYDVLDESGNTITDVKQNPGAYALNGEDRIWVAYDEIWEDPDLEDDDNPLELVGYEQTEDVGVYRAAVAAKLLEDTTIEIKEIKNDDGVIATRTLAGEEEPIVAISKDFKELSYTLAEKLPVSGKATITLLVKRANYSDIEFTVNLVADGQPPVISVLNTDLGKDASDKVQDADDLDVKKTFVRKAPEFTVTATDVEGGLYYTFANKAFADEAEAEASYQAALADDFDASKNWFAVKGTTIAAPDKDGGYVLYVRGEDKSGNVTYVTSLTGYTLDSTAPRIVKASDNKFEFGEEAKPLLVNVGAKGAVAVLDDYKVTVTAGLGDATPATIEPNAATLNYMLEANADTYTVKATDEAGNVTVAKIDVNYAVDNVGNDIKVAYVGEDYDLTTVVDKNDAEKKLYVKSEKSGAISFANGTDKVLDDGKTYVYQGVAGTRGAGTIEGNILKPTQAGTFVIEVISEKNGIWGVTTVPAYITVEKGVREVGISLVEDKTAETPVAKDTFTKTEAANIKDYTKLSYSIKSADPDQKYVKYTYYDKATGKKLDAAPTVPGEYEVSVALETDGLWEPANSENATAEGLNKKVSYTVVATNKVVVTNDDTKGTITVNDGTKDLTADDLKAVADRTALTIKAEAKDGYAFAGWTDVTGVELTADQAKADTVTVASVSGDIALTANYVAKIKITKQPADVAAQLDGSAEFSVVATGNGEDDLTYQWQMKTAEEKEFKNILGATAASYKIDKVSTTNNGETYRVVLTSKSTGEVVNSAEAKLTIGAKSIEKAVITFANNDAAYTGAQIKPEIASVTLDGVQLSEKRDFTMNDTNFVEAGTYTVTITGTGDYAGTATAEFRITKTKVVVAVGTAKLTDKVYDGTVEMKTEGALEVTGIPAGSDLKVTALPETVKVEDKNAGEKTYVLKITLTGEDKNNVELGNDSVELKGNITKKGVTLNDMTFKPKYYDGSKYMELTTQKGVIKSGLIEGDDVQFTTKQAKYVITGTKSAGQKKRKLTKGLWNITGKDAANYKLAAGPTATGTIKKVVVKKVTLKATSVKYNGKAQKPVIKAITGTNGVKVLQKNCKIEYFRGSKETVDFKSKGKITVKVTGVGTPATGSNWKGTVSVTYTIK